VYSQRPLREAEAELQEKDAQIRALHVLGSHGDEGLRQELRRLLRDIEELQLQCQAQEDPPVTAGPGSVADSLLSGAAGPPSQASSAACAGAGGGGSSMRQRAAVLEEELKCNNDAVARLRQRELWFEQQLRRQRQVNEQPLGELLDEIVSLQSAAAQLLSARADAGGGAGGGNAALAPAPAAAAGKGSQVPPLQLQLQQQQQGPLGQRQWLQAALQLKEKDPLSDHEGGAAAAAAVRSNLPFVAPSLPVQPWVEANVNGDPVMSKMWAQLHGLRESDG